MDQARLSRLLNSEEWKLFLEFLEEEIFVEVAKSFSKGSEKGGLLLQGYPFLMEVLDSYKLKEDTKNREKPERLSIDGDVVHPVNK